MLDLKNQSIFLEKTNNLSVPQSDSLPPLSDWTLEDSEWIEKGKSFRTHPSQNSYALKSPRLTLSGQNDIILFVVVEFKGFGSIQFGLLRVKNERQVWVDSKIIQGEGEIVFTHQFHVPEDGEYHLVIANAFRDSPGSNEVVHFNIFHNTIKSSFDIQNESGPLNDIDDTIIDVPSIYLWKIHGSWKENATILKSKNSQLEFIAEQGRFRFKKGARLKVPVSFEFDTEGRIEFGIIETLRWKWVNSRIVRGKGPVSFTFYSVIPANSDYTLAIANYYPDGPRITRLKHIHIGPIQVLEKKRIQIPAASSSDCSTTSSPSQNGDTFLPHWGYIKRSIHSLCKRSWFWNHVVAAWEMKWNRKELLSLPQYMALCPTGQCNALCGFCSVTTKRTGIIKRQLPFDKLSRFLAPVSNTIQMFGLEGNGEPTLYDRFDELTQLLIQNGSYLYLITNGEKLTPEQIDYLISIPITSVTFSLNAATSETHNKVMKLKNFHRVLENIKRFTYSKKENFAPNIAVSFVVHNDNIHETQAFLDLAENELLTDIICLRPLSEIANEISTVDDTRDIVPFESDVRDMIDAVHDYLHDVPRRSRIEFQPDTFRSVRPDPPDRIVRPAGFESRLLPPRRNDWFFHNSDLSVSWYLNTLHVQSDTPLPSGSILSSAPIPVVPYETVQFRCEIFGKGAPLTCIISTMHGIEIARYKPNLPENSYHYLVDLSIQVGENYFLCIHFMNDEGRLDRTIDFERLRTPGVGLIRDIKLPYPQRWEKDTQETVIRWEGNRLDLSYDGKPGLYLMKSYTVPCLTNMDVELPFEVEVQSGTLVLGILNEDASQWIRQFPYEQGFHSSSLQFNTQDNRSFKVVICAQKTPLSISLDWLDSLVPSPKRFVSDKENDKTSRDKSPRSRSAKSDKEKTSMTKADGSSMKSEGKGKPQPTPSKKIPSFSPFFRRLLYGKPRFYCQKPWTDLHNFTVDGRMDVCCIATGASQEKFAYGNIFNQEFQEIWNGEVAQEFRRTVNSKEKPLPCQRCPLAKKYQGFFFDYSNAMLLLEFNIDKYLSQSIWTKWCTPLIKSSVRGILRVTLFRGFYH